MAKTAVADIIIPTEFERYAIERTAELSAFGQCGIVEHAPEFDELANMGGRTAEFPYWENLTATPQLLSVNGSQTGIQTLPRCLVALVGHLTQFGKLLIEFNGGNNDLEVVLERLVEAG
jgi:hypothetical protein